MKDAFPPIYCDPCLGVKNQLIVHEPNRSRDPCDADCPIAPAGNLSTSCLRDVTRHRSLQNDASTTPVLVRQTKRHPQLDAWRGKPLPLPARTYSSLKQQKKGRKPMHHFSASFPIFFRHYSCELTSRGTAIASRSPSQTGGALKHCNSGQPRQYHSYQASRIS